MKKLITYRLLMALLLPVWLSAGTIQMSIPDTTGVRGATILIPVRIDNSVTGSDVTSYQLEIQFDNNYLALDSVTKSGTMTEAASMSFTFNRTQPNIVTVAAAGSQPLQGTGVLIYLRFRLLNSGLTSISFTNTNNNILNEGTPAVVLINGSLNAIEPPSIAISPDQGLLSIGEQLQFSVSGGTAPYNWSVTNPSVASINATGLLSASNVGTTRVVVTDLNKLVDTTNNVVEIRALNLSVHDTSTYVGHTFDLPIYCTSVTGLGIISGSVTLNFNGDILTPIGVVQAGTILQSFPEPSVNTTVKGNVGVAFAGSTPLSGSGILFYVRFTSSANSGSTTVDFSNVLFNENILAKTINGSVNSQALVPLNLNYNTTKLLVGDTLRFSVSNGTPPFSWTTSDTTVARIDIAGLVTAIKSGSIQVVVQDALGAKGTSNTIHIYDTQTAIGNVDAPQGGQVDIPILIQRFQSGPSISGFQLSVGYDTSVIKAVSIINTGTLSNGWSLAPNISGNTITVASANAVGFNTTGTLIKMRFQVSPTISAGYQSSVQFRQLLFNEGSPTVLTSDGIVTIVVPPSAPQLVAPGNGALNQPTSLTLQWNASSSAASYRIQVATDSNFVTGIVSDDSTVTGISRAISGLANSTTYYWHVNAKNNAGSSQYSPVRKFTTIIAAPAVPVQSMPSNGSLDQPISLTLRWFPAARAGSYHLQFGTDSTFKNGLIINDSTIVDTMKLLSSLNNGTKYYWRVSASNVAGTSAWSSAWRFTIGPPNGVEKNSEVPKQFTLAQNYPNPFNPATTIVYTLSEDDWVTLKVFDILGREIKILVNGIKRAGITYQVEFNASKLPSGIYLYRLQAGEKSLVKKLTIMK